MNEREMTPGRRSPVPGTWANGLGEWFARVPRDAQPSPLEEARRLLREEIMTRRPDAPEACWRDLVRVDDLDTDTTLVFREGDCT